MPMMPGSARGFFITAWSRTPDTASAAPPSIAINMRGKRRSYIVATFSLYDTNSPSSSSRNPTLSPPVFTASKNSRTSPAIVNAKARALRFVLFNLQYLLVPVLTRRKAWVLILPAPLCSESWRSYRIYCYPGHRPFLPAPPENAARYRCRQTHPGTLP